MQSPYSSSSPAASELACAGLGSRALATVYDSLLLMIVIGIIGFIFRAGITYINGAMTINPSGPALALQIIIPLVYYIILEATMGATIGKRFVGLRVTKADGSPAGWGGSIVRNLLRMIDGLLCYLLGALFVITSPAKQRLGDRLAKTVVVRRS